MFVDETRVHLRSGDGGAGIVAYHRVRGKPRGKPEGGSGGSGGDVLVIADPNVSTLLDYRRRPHRRAGDGTHGRGDLRDGRRGEDLTLSLPIGTVVRDHDDVILADLAKPGFVVTLVEGGRGGRGNASLVSRRHHAPSFAEQGEYGEERMFTFELKLIADAALIGFPNAGKSTMISRVSAARPKIADYPFTTLEPSLGVVEVGDRVFVMADIPGLIEGAANGRGLGHAFLRHAERARVLVIQLDPSPLQTDDAERQLEVLTDELGRHDPALAVRPRVFVVAKADLPDAAEVVERLSKIVSEPIHLVSAVTGVGIVPLLHAIADRVEESESTAQERDAYVRHRPAPPSFEISRDGDRWIVAGRRAVRAVALDDLTRPEAADLAARRLSRAGVDAALRHAGAQPGDEVQIGDIVFEFTEDDNDSADRGAT